jgi:hypothetical protein
LFATFEKLNHGFKRSFHSGHQGKSKPYFMQVLISRNYRGDIPMSSIDKFMPLIYLIEEEELAPSPIISSEDGIHFLYIKHNNLYCK